MRQKLLLKMVTIGLLFSYIVLTYSEESRLNVAFNVDYYSRYGWRGMILTDDPVVQPSGTISIDGWSLNIWGSWDTTDINEKGNSGSGPKWRLQELDYTISYTHELPYHLNGEVGAIFYTFPGTNYEETIEIYGGLSSSFSWFTSTIKIYRDIDEVKGNYLNLNLGGSWELVSNLTLGINAIVGWGDKKYHDYYLSTNTRGFSDANLVIRLDYPIIEGITGFLSVSRVWFLRDDLEEGAETVYGRSRRTIVGFGVAWFF